MGIKKVRLSENLGNSVGFSKHIFIGIDSLLKKRYPLKKSSY